MYLLRAILLISFAVLPGCAAFVSGKLDTAVSVAPIAAPEIEPYVRLVEPLQPVDVWDVVRHGFMLDHESQRPAVARAVEAYLSSAPLMPALEVRALRYFAYVVDAVKQRHLPMELALLPIIESTLNPYAFSGSGAAGLWQIVPATAKQQGLTIDWWYDGRRDLLDSTTAALDYLTYLHDEFGDWLLAIAAYNGGQGRIRRALTRSPGSGFFELKLPRETQRYVPRVLALAHLIAEDNGFVLPPITPQPPFFVTTIEDQIDLESLSVDGSPPLDEVFSFNPGLNRRATPPDRPYRLLIPTSYRTEIEDALNHLRSSPAPPQRHRVKHGETLSSIAKRYHTSEAAIRAGNDLTNKPIHPNQSLVIPGAAIAPATLAGNPMLNSGPQWYRYKTKQGDSLWSISRRLHTSIQTLVRANQLNPAAPLGVGQILAVPRQGSTHRMTYTVRRGDSLARIANSYNVSVAAIVAWNKVDPSAILKPGLRLVLHIPASHDWS